jgi:Ca-activated chloride channel family protein
MTKSLTLLREEEVQRCVPADEEAGFGALATERGHLPLRAIDVQARIDGLLSQVDLRQTFVNTLGEALEATYIFPLPDRAAVTRFRMAVAGRVIEGVLQERAQARKEYEQALQAGHRAAITEEERPNVFTMRVGNLLPGEEATVHLTLVGPLPFSDGEATFRFPLVVAPRYHPGTPLPGPSVGDGTVPDTDAVPDASRLSPPVLLPGYPNPVHLSLAVDVSATGLPLGDFRSSLHTVLTEDEGQVRRLRLQPGERINRDFVLRFRLGDAAIQTALCLKPDAGGQEGTFVLTLVPPVDAARAQKPRDVVFVLDRSGSMAGWKIVAARRALARMVDTLTDRDRFSLLVFDNTVETLPEFQGVGLVAASNRNRFRAVEFLARIEARGGTEMARPLDLGVRQLAGAERDRERILVLVTDGQVGNEDQILRELAPRVQDLRIFTLGIDRAVNEGFLQRLAMLGGGAAEIVESEDRLDAVMDKVHRRIGTPVLTGLRLEPAGLHFDAETIVPTRLPDLFSGAPLCILGRYRGAATGGLALQAGDAAGRAWTETVSATVRDNSAIPAVWARGHVRALEDRFVTGSGDRPQLEKRIVETSLRFGVLCRFTAFVAVDRSEVVNKGGKGHRIMQPVEAPEGWAMLETLATHRGALPPQACVAGAAVERGNAPDVRWRRLPLQRRHVEPSRAEAAPAPESEGLLQRLFGSLVGSRKPPQAPPSTPLDVSAYRRRAQELLEHLQQQANQDVAARRIELGVVAGKLEALIEDLKSIHAATKELRPLEELLQDLRAFLAEDRPAEAEVATLWSKAEAVLRAFSGAPAGRRESFWK